MSLVVMHEIVKAFAGKPALADVSFTVEPGEVHALVGENGAGKTTLMNILFAIYHADAGAIFWNQTPAAFRSPREAIAAGIGMVHQHFMLVPTLTVSENITLGMPLPRRMRRDRAAVNRTLSDLSVRYGLDVDLDARIQDLSVGVQQRVEILKLLYRDAQLLILDEPTAVLTPQETDRFFPVLESLRAAGKSVVLVTHRLSEVSRISDRVTVLRNGRLVDTKPMAETNETEIARKMIGRAPTVITAARRSDGSATDGRTDRGGPEPPPAVLGGLIVRDLHWQGPVDAANAGLSFTAAGGEIFGIAGVDGNGQKELFETLVGLRGCVAGSIELDGEDLTHNAIRRRRDLGLAFISDDRHRDSLVMALSAVDNLLLGAVVRDQATRNGLVNRSAARNLLAQLTEQYGIVMAAPDTPVSWMSGGNQQKLVMARELLGRPRCIVAFQPTRGLDIAAGEFVESRLIAAAAAGCAVLLISGDLDQLLRLSNRLAVIQKRRITGQFDDPQSADIEHLGLLMGGYQPGHRAAAHAAAGAASDGESAAGHPPGGES